ncbi:hypothetical protein GQ44DRAFT_330912 [Phaeosphaeriaceae sp. PMI808]|nr:hypothetical protein GQ44DRAFT_330912 [Phaeosphaeriaceae sp. PMI808]
MARPTNKRALNCIFVAGIERVGSESECVLYLVQCRLLPQIRLLRFLCSVTWHRFVFIIWSVIVLICQYYSNASMM